MEPTKAKRITIRLKSPNPLFEKWLTEWRDKAKEKNAKMQHTLNIALKSLKKYPVPLDSGKDCIILKGFGATLCKMLDDKLKEHKTKHTNGDTTIDYEYVEEQPKKQYKKKTPKKTTKNNKSYVPAYRSGPYAILITLLRKSQEPGFSGFLTKQEIIDSARDLCDKSFTKPDPGSFYTAWSSMTNLVTKKLIEKQGSPPKFSLTPDGFDVAFKLLDTIENNNTDINKPSSSKNVDEVATINDIVNYNIGSTSDIKINEIVNTENSIPKKNSDMEKTSEMSQENSKSSRESSSSQTSSTVETIIFAPGSFDIILIVDNQETEGKNKCPLNDDTKYELHKSGVLYEVRHMKVGDFTWICQERTTKNELVLPYIVERKRIDDLGSSIKDGRFHEQKFRLKQCGIQNLIYIVESYGNNTHTGLPLSSLMQAATNTHVQDGFQVKFTDSHKHSMQYLACFSRLLKEYYENKTVMSCQKEDLQKHNISDDLISLMTFKEFNKGGAKQKKFTVKEMFVKHLIQLKDLSVDKAQAIVEKYPTPRLLMDEYDKVGPDGEKLLSKIQFGPLKRCIGIVISRTIYQLYTNEVLL